MNTAVGMTMDPATDVKGAEAVLTETEYLGRPAMIKIRMPKAYRHPDLDRRIRISRIRTEARLAGEARRAGVRTPLIYDVDVTRTSITMELIGGMTAKTALDDGSAEPGRVCRMIGEAVARLHNRGLTHGDLTTSNMMIDDAGRLCLLDLSMGTSGAGIEDMGVELRLLERAFVSAHPHLEDLYPEVLEAYGTTMADPEAVLRKVKEIGDRGRYT